MDEYKGNHADDNMDEQVEPGESVPTTLTREEILALPARERISYVNRVRVFHPQWDAITEAVRMCHEENTGEGEPECALIIGQTGTGKSTLVVSYCDEWPPEFSAAGGLHRYIRRALYVRCFSPATATNVATAVLLALGDPRAQSGTLSDKTLRIYHMLDACGVEIMFVDELQHFIDQKGDIRGNGKILFVATDWFKNLIKETGVACVFVGLPEAEQVVRMNKQLGRLFGDPYELAPFAWDEQRPETIQEFRDLLDDIEAALPLRDDSDLSSLETALRCFTACGGIIGYLMKLLRGAARLALRSGLESIDYELLATAYNRKLAPKRRGIPNPFIDAR